MHLKQELIAIRDSCGWYEASDWGHFRLQGPDTISFLHRLVTSHIQQQAIGTGAHTALLDRKGKVQSLFYLLKLSETMVQGYAPKLAADAAFALLKKYIISEHVEIQDVSKAYTLFSCYGPKSTIPKEEIGTLMWREDLYHVPTSHVLVPTFLAEKYRSHFREQAMKLSKTCLEVLRLRANIPMFGVDIGPENILLEGNLQHTFVRQKGCYPGQEVIERLCTYADGKTPRVITTIQLDGKQAIEKAGQITSVEYDPLEDKTLVMKTMKRKEL